MFKLKLKAEVQALFQFNVRKKGSEEVIKTTSWFPNIVLNNGLDRLGGGGVSAYCRVGVGASTPAATQTQLDQQVASTSDLQGGAQFGVNSAQGYSYIRKTFRFDTGVAAGNISEVGVGWAGSGDNSLFNRALIRDTSNNITTVTVLSDEVLDVLVELRSYVSLTPKSALVSVSGTQYELAIQPYISSDGNIFSTAYACTGSNGYSGAIANATSAPAGHLGSFGVVNKTYIPGTLKRDFEVFWGLNSGNAAPLRTVVSSTPYCTYQVEMTPAIPKTSETVLRLAFQVSWGRYE